MSFSPKIPPEASRHYINFSHLFENTVSAFVSDSSVDFAIAKDSFELTSLQKEFLKNKIGDAVSNAVIFKQVHGGDVVRLESGRAYDGPREADGFITQERNFPLMVRTADCLSIFLFDPKAHAIGLVHAGWRSTQKEIVKNAVRKMQAAWDTKPRDLKIVLGPCIQSCCYEVGKEFQEIFPSETIEQGGQFYLDLALVNLHQIESLGVDLKNVRDCGICTCCGPKLFSHRRDGEKAGRMVSVLLLQA